MVMIPPVPIAETAEDAPLPRYPELVRLSLRVDRPLSTEDETDAQLAAQSLDYLAALTAELDRARPRRRARSSTADDP